MFSALTKGFDRYCFKTHAKIDLPAALVMMERDTLGTRAIGSLSLALVPRVGTGRLLSIKQIFISKSVFLLCNEFQRNEFAE